MSMPILAPVQVQRARGLQNLPSHLLIQVLEDLSVLDLYSFAQVSKACNQAVKKDVLWRPRLENMGLWKQQPENQKGAGPSQADKFTAVPEIGTSLAYEGSASGPKLQEMSLLSLDPISNGASQYGGQSEFQDSPLDILEKVGQVAVQGNAKATFTRIFKCLYPYYHDILQSGTHTEPAIFRVYRDPVDQAKLLAQLKVFARCDPQELDHYDNLDKLASVYEVFENAALAEFENGFDDNDMEGRVKEFARVLITLNGGESCIQLFIQKNQLVYDSVGEASDFLDEHGKLDTKKLQEMLKNTSDSINKEAKVIDAIFPPTALVLSGLCQHIIEENISDLFVAIITLCKEKDVKYYLEAVPFLYVYFMWFLESLEPPPASAKEFKKNLKEHFLNIYDIYVEAYLEEEVSEFSRYAKAEVLQWKKAAHDAEVAVETLLLSNVSKTKDKKDILASFKKVLMMPVSVIPFGGNSSPAPQQSESASASTASIPNQLQKSPQNDSNVSLPAGASTPDSLRPPTPSLGRTDTFVKRASLMPATLPTTEFDARMAVMANRLGGINTLFSLELALNIIRAGRDAIERAGKFVSIGGDLGTEAKEHCEAIFVELVRSVGGVHMRSGFEKALETLQNYDATNVQKSVVGDGDGKDEQEHNSVEPLAIFAELVNIGDLIQQMVHVFFEEELALRGYIDRNSFVSPAIKEKRNFEKMLDSYVADGLNKGIDVLMNQIDYIFLTDQKATDFFPAKTGEGSGSKDPTAGDVVGKSNRGSIIFKSTSDFDMSPTLAARKVVSLLKLHTGLLAGSTDRSVIDVFQQEVGVRFFGSLCKHIKRQVISVDGSVKLLLDLNHYYNFVLTLKQQPVTPYFAALKEVGQMYLISGNDAKELGKMLSDMTRFGGIFTPEEVFEFARSREDWMRVKKDVEKVMYGFGVADCTIM